MGETPRADVRLVLLFFSIVVAATGCNDRGSSVSSTPEAPASVLKPAPSPPAPATSTPSAVPSSSAATPSTPPPPPYDLAADLAVRSAAARLLFPPAKYPAFASRVEGDVFLLVSPQGRAALDAGAAELRRALAFYYGGRSSPADAKPPFAHRPLRAVTVVLLQPRAAFLAFALRHYHHDASEELGFYEVDPREIVLSASEGLGTLDHELVHVATEVDAPDLPKWAGECLGTVFEQPVFDPDGTMHGARNKRIELLADAIRDTPADAPGFADLFGMGTHAFNGGSPFGADGGYDQAAKDAAKSLNYARARALCLWMDGKPRETMWAFYHAWRDGMASDPTGVKAFEKVMGRPPKELEEEWRRWVMGN